MTGALESIDSQALHAQSNLRLCAHPEGHVSIAKALGENFRTRNFRISRFNMTFTSFVALFCHNDVNLSIGPVI